jgi:hypothetical protein
MALAPEGTPLRKLQDSLAEIVGPSFVEASDHPYTCKCHKCKAWWKEMGPDPDTDSYGPFTQEEIEND